MYFVSESTAQQVVSIQDAIQTIESMFMEYAYGDAEVFSVAQGHGTAVGTSFSIKSGLLMRSEALGLKVGSYWPDNRALGMASHASSTLLLDATTGYAKALIAASYLTGLRTAASDAVAVKHLSREDSHVLALVGAGHQAWHEVCAVCAVRPIQRVLVCNRSHGAAAALAERIRSTLRCEALVLPVEEALEQADIVVTVTASQQPLFDASLVRAGTHISAMGADSPGKQELDPALFRRASLFADVLTQSISIGEFEKACTGGLIEINDITPLGAVLTGTAGRTEYNQITVYDSSGMALQDIAIGELALRKAQEQGLAQSLA
ncbi:MAG: ornithine cyclodeaminase family protein [Desulfovibrionaceae bacterium]|nr:ornithine cyclodeaminase family protein [Desulfovibrionaceae bacterium]